MNIDDLTLGQIKQLKSVVCPDHGKQSEELTGEPYVIVRSDRAGVFAGYLVSRKSNGQYSAVEMRESRRIWYWSGAASLSQLAVDGTSKPENCKFPVALDKHFLDGVVEVIPCTAKAKASIQGVKVWAQ